MYDGVSTPTNKILFQKKNWNASLKFFLQLIIRTFFFFFL